MRIYQMVDGTVRNCTFNVLHKVLKIALFGLE